MPFKYWTYGAAATEVELDVLTGAHKVLRADIVMDLGQPLNPALDIGQIEGAYVQVRCLSYSYLFCPDIQEHDLLALASQTHADPVKACACTPTASRVSMASYNQR